MNYVSTTLGTSCKNDRHKLKVYVGRKYKVVFICKRCGTKYHVERSYLWLSN